MNQSLKVLLTENVTAMNADMLQLEEMAEILILINQEFGPNCSSAQKAARRILQNASLTSRLPLSIVSTLQEIPDGLSDPSMDVSTREIDWIYHRLVTSKRLIDYFESVETMLRPLAERRILQFANDPNSYVVPVDLRGDCLQLRNYFWFMLASEWSRYCAVAIGNYEVSPKSFIKHRCAESFWPVQSHLSFLLRASTRLNYSLVDNRRHPLTLVLLFLPPATPSPIFFLNFLQAIHAGHRDSLVSITCKSDSQCSRQ